MKFAGQNAKFAMKIGSGSYVDVSGILRSVSFDKARDTGDVTTFDNDGWKENLSLLRSATGSIEGVHDDELIEALFDVEDSDDVILLRCRPNGDGVGKPEWVWNIVGFTVSTSFDVQSESGVSGSFTVNGAPTRTVQ